jgi:formamidopyrimidine-DNA glycosylase
MPELPDITLYIEALRQRVHGCPLERSKISSAFLLRSVEPQLADRSLSRLLKKHWPKSIDEFERLQP